MQLVAFGDNADDEKISEGANVTVYFGSARKGRSEDEDGAIWLYDNAWIEHHHDSIKATIARFREEVKIR